MGNVSSRSRASKTKYLALVLPIFSLASAVHTGCSSGGSGGGYGYGTDGGASSSGSSGSSGGSCSGGAVSCSNGTLTACENGVRRTATCEAQCKADGFQPGTTCSKDGTRCACGETTDVVCTDAIDATCTCLDTAPGCQGTAILDNYIRCHRDPSSETAILLKCFAKYKSGGQVACNTAITSCGGSGPSNSCKADVDCGHCERCELSTGKCLTKLACN